MKINITGKTLKMKTIKSIAAAILLLISAAAIGQEKKMSDVQKTTMENYSEEFTEYLNRLDLSEEQQPKFIEISKRYREQFKALKNSSKSRLSKYREYKGKQNNKNSEMKSLLSQEQYEVYLEVQEEVQKKVKENNGK